jgi:MFS family permease
MAFADATKHPTRRARKALLRATLLCTPLLDELTIGFLVVALPLLRDSLHLSYEQIGFIFTAGALSSMVLEPGINLLSDRRAKRLPVLAGMLLTAAAFVLAGITQSYIALLLAMAVLFPANGAGVGLSQAALIEADPAHAPRTMARWTLLAGVGDLLAPVIVGLVAVRAQSWSVLCGLAAALWLALLFVALPQRFPTASDNAPGEDDAEPRVGLLAAMREALRDRVLLRWVGIVLLCTMLDEVFLSFSGLYLSDALHVDSRAVSVALGTMMAGAIIALLILERLLHRVRGERLLPWLALVALAGILLLLATHVYWLAVVALVLVGCGAAGWYPIAKAAAFGTRPARTGTVLAVVALGAPFETALPTLVGLIAGHFGIAAGIAFLGMAPLAVLALLPRGQHQAK